MSVNRVEQNEVPRLALVATLAIVGIVAGMASPAAAAPPPAPGTDGAGWCGTQPNGLAITLAKDRLRKRQLDRGFVAATAAGLVPAAASPAVRNEDNLAVIVDDGSIISTENLFDMANRGLRFKRIKKIDGVKAQKLGAGAYRAALGEKLELGDDDAVELDYPANAGFPFYGVRYESVWVHSDGNLSFEEPDAASTARDLGRFLGGPPRIAPLFNDMNPETAVGRGGVYARVLGKKLQITWFEVPEFGTTNMNTFQVTLFPRGKITFVWKRVDADTGVVGVSPGGLAGLELADLSKEPPLPATAFAVAEDFSDSEQISEASIAQTVLRHFEDQYTHIVTFLDFPFALLGGGAIAFEVTVKNPTRGIGQSVYDSSGAFGSSGALESFVQMGSLQQYHANPDRKKFGTLSSMDIVAHETGHRWLATARFRDASGSVSQDLLGRQRAHWSFHKDSDASVMEGNEFSDNGDGTFTTLVRDASYSPLDLYLMGMIGEEEVPEFFYVDNASGPPADSAPDFGVTIRGKRVDVGIDAVVSAIGKRRPSVEEAPKDFRMAFVLLARKGEEPSQESIDKANMYRREWEKAFRSLTRKIGSVDTTLDEL